MNVKQIFVVTSIALTLAILVLGLINAYFLLLFLIVGPIIAVGIVDMVQKKQTIRRNFPIIGNFRYMLEKVRPEIMQYFVETDTEGRPINRLYRSVIYQRAKKEVSKSPFGTQWDVYHPGYEWIDHSVYAVNPHDLEQEQRVLVGGPDCFQALFSQPPKYLGNELRISEQECGVGDEQGRSHRKLRTEYGRGRP